MMDEGAIWVDFIEDGISIAAFAGSECHYFEVPAHSFEEADGEGTDSHKALLIGLIERQADLHVIRAHSLLRAVEESFIQIQDQCLSEDVLGTLGKGMHYCLFWQGQGMAGAQYLNGERKMLQGTLIESRHSPGSLTQVVALHSLRPHDPFLTPHCVQQLLLTLQIYSALLQLVQQGLLHPPATPSGRGLETVQLETASALLPPHTFQLFFSCQQFLLQLSESRHQRTAHCALLPTLRLPFPLPLLSYPFREYLCDVAGAECDGEFSLGEAGETGGRRGDGWGGKSVVLFVVLLRLVPAMSFYSGHLIISTHNAHCPPLPPLNTSNASTVGQSMWMMMKPLRIDQLCKNKQSKIGIPID